jgi:hypothetical protein
MSTTAHQAAIDADAGRLQTQALVASFTGLRCPFCGLADLFVHPPGTRHWTGTRTWWTVGCDSPRCNSCWTLNADTYEGVMSKIQHTQPKETNSA